MGSGAILNEVIAGADILAEKFGVESDIWSVPSFNELRKDAVAINRRNRLKPEEAGEMPYISRQLANREGPVVAATDYVRGYADQVRAFIPQRDYLVLGTDGFGRSDTRENCAGSSKSIATTWPMPRWRGCISARRSAVRSFLPRAKSSVSTRTSRFPARVERNFAAD